ncbi:dipeptidase [Microlunatus flavus]|uniref:Membrane dipeptidase n=1 Tax=Microlunatus flavus TaxID=1036181 RepID=A0A1H9D5M0_9ACTN|nr:membrane dipeptidase [Microlunatus flavus]SEQ08745.1 membrane dipeptidase [Microlunatus flavus]
MHPAASDPSDTSALDLHRHARGFVPQPFRAAWRALTPAAPAEVGLGRLREEGGGAAVVCAVGDGVVTRTHLGRSPFDAVEAQLAGAEREAAAAGSVVARSVAALRAAQASGAPAVLLGVEGADALGGDPAALERLDAWAGRGVRLVGLVHLADNALGTTSLPWQRYAGPLPVRRPARPGLTALGTRVVRRMNDRGLLVDVAHADRATLLGVVEATSAPVVASHTGARALQDFVRYLADDELVAVAGTGGLVGLWPFRHRRTGVHDVAALVAHARHVAGLVGPEHLALGTDTNGVPGVMAGFEDGDPSRVAAALVGAGFTPAEVRGILGGNALRVLTDVEQCARGGP